MILFAAGCAMFRSEERPAEHSRATQLDYIEKYKKVAIKEMNRGGVPASIILAQAMLESASGSSELAKKANNHFGLKCTDDWNGPTLGRKDDDRDSRGSLVDSCFRRYDNVADSYADYSEFMREYRRYRFLFDLDPTDYKGWARGLQSAGYATSSEYSDRLIELIEHFRLYQYDRAGSNRQRGSG
jgi:flagellum-specific peptidoglycan hydrolase FlgJ